MNKLLSRASSPISTVPNGKFEKYNLMENPFPSTAILNKDSSEKKSNGSIYEPEIRTVEYTKLLKNFIQTPQADLNHHRLGFLLDSSYVGRGNGKTAFLLNLIKQINANYCLDLSERVNKCFAVYCQPEAGGKTKTFDSFIDLFFQALIESNIIKNSLAILRLTAIVNLTGTEEFVSRFKSDDEIIETLNNVEWFKKLNITKELPFSKREIAQEILKDKHLQNLPPDFPLCSESKNYLTDVITQIDFVNYYASLKKGYDRLNFIFTDLVNVLLAAGFNGAFIFIDDFERIPDHQSAIQKKDFATQLRTVLFDGLYLNSKIGFFNFILALHAGVPRILQEAWGESGLEHRVSMNPTIDNPKHMILFDRINEVHAILLIEKYLSEYRISDSTKKDHLFPFTPEAIKLIGIKSEMNAARILQSAYNIIDRAAEDNVPLIDDKYVATINKQSHVTSEIEMSKDSISKTQTTDLLSKAAKND